MFVVKSIVNQINGLGYASFYTMLIKKQVILTYIKPISTAHF